MINDPLRCDHEIIFRFSKTKHRSKRWWNAIPSAKKHEGIETELLSCQKKWKALLEGTCKSENMDESCPFSSTQLLFCALVCTADLSMTDFFHLTFFFICSLLHERQHFHGFCWRIKPQCSQINLRR
ncbi:hypothetical protein CEXT_596551 [Caerostris extrusa]|uniref:Uncharacterized protein n=1 Tax=Caerostris extrusa TaxID=172846 RepID=A0AAV4QJT0_CAEEX|nr:hypothetical protein CEXT_596551 [Caerostris extrusa]